MGAVRTRDWLINQLVAARLELAERRVMP